MSKYGKYVYVNLRSGEVHTFFGEFENIPKAMEYASKTYTVNAKKPHLWGFMVLLMGNGMPAYPVGYKHPKIPSIALSRHVDITKAQSYFDLLKKGAVYES